MRRTVTFLALVGAVTLWGGAVAIAQGEPSIPTDVADQTLMTQRVVPAPGGGLAPGTETDTAELPDDTKAVGVTWTGDPEAGFDVEVQGDDGEWTEVADLHEADGGPDEWNAEGERFAAATAGGRFSSEPILAKDPQRVRVRVVEGTTVTDLQLKTVATPDGDARDALDDEAAAAAGFGVGGAALVAVGLGVGLPGARRRRTLVALVVGAVALGGALSVLRALDARKAGDHLPRRVGAGPSNGCPGNASNVRQMVLHHTVNPNGYGPGDSAGMIRGIQGYHQSIDYCDIGYNFVVDRYGQIFEGRSGGVTSNVIGAHATNFNTGTVGIAMLGDFSSSSVWPPGATFYAVADLMAWRMSVGNIDPWVPVTNPYIGGPPLDVIIGHRDAGAVSGDGTSCPGDGAYHILPGLRDNVKPRVFHGYPMGKLDRLKRTPTGIVVSGYAIDPDTTGPINVHVYVDGVAKASTPANRPRNDVASKFPGFGPNHGYEVYVPTGPGDHTVCVYGINVGEDGTNALVGKCKSTGHNPYGSFDFAQRQAGKIRVGGWAVDPDTAAPIQVHVYANGVGIGAITANTSRPDVGAALPGFGSNHGYDALLSGPSGSVTVCTYGINTGPGGNALLGCRAV